MVTYDLIDREKFSRSRNSPYNSRIVRTVSAKPAMQDPNTVRFLFTGLQAI